MPSRRCTICGDTERFHVHDGERIENYFTVGRGQTDFEAAQEWKARALKYREALEAIRIYVRAPHHDPACGDDLCIDCLIEGTSIEALEGTNALG